MTKDRAPRVFYGYVVVLAVFIIMVISWGGLYSFGVFLKPLASRFGWSVAVTTGAYSVYMLTHGPLYIVAGRVLDQFGPRLLMTVCGVFLGAGYLLLSQVQSAWQLYLYYGIFIGIGMTGYYAPLLSVVARWFAKRRSLMTGVAVCGVGVGNMIVPPTATWLITTYGLSTSFTIIGIVTLIVTVVASQFLKQAPVDLGIQRDAKPAGDTTQTQERAPSASLTFREALGTRQFWLYFFTWACFAVGLQTVLVHVVAYATVTLTTAAIAATILTVMGGASIIGRLALGGMGDRIGNKAAYVVCFALTVPTLLWLAGINQMATLYVFAAIFGLGYGGQVTVVSPMAADLFGLRAHGTIFGATAFGATLGGAVGPVLAGFIFDATGSYQLAFVICAVAMAIGLVLLLLIKPIGQKNADGLLAAERQAR